MNAIDPTVAKERQSIYEFTVQARDPICLGPATRNRIENNLSMLDLFSFDVDKKQPLRHNFEELFTRYETDVEAHTLNLLGKLAQGDHQLKDEVVNLFAAKLLNFARNPYSIPKILNTFGVFGSFTPLWPEVAELFGKVLNGRRRHQQHLCTQLGISDVQYEQWLRMLFTMLVELAPGFPPMFDQIVKSVFESKATAMAVLVSTYDAPKCLLSDRGFSTNLADVRADGFDFNLCSTAFIRYVVMDRKPPNIPAWIPQEAINDFMKVVPPVQLHLAHEDQALLRGFNMNVINQCHGRVFCATDTGIVF